MSTGSLPVADVITGSLPVLMTRSLPVTDGVTGSLPVDFHIISTGTVSGSSPQKKQQQKKTFAGGIFRNLNTPNSIQLRLTILSLFAVVIAYTHQDTAVSIHYL